MLLERVFANRGLNGRLTSELTQPVTMEPALRYLFFADNIYFWHQIESVRSITVQNVGQISEFKKCHPTTKHLLPISYTY